MRKRYRAKPPTGSGAQLAYWGFFSRGICPRIFFGMSGALFGGNWGRDNFYWWWLIFHEEMSEGCFWGMRGGLCSGEIFRG